MTLQVLVTFRSQGVNAEPKSTDATFTVVQVPAINIPCFPTKPAEICLHEGPEDVVLVDIVSSLN